MTITPIQHRIDQLRTHLESLGVDELGQELAADPELLLIDIREIQERVDRGAIPSSVHVPRGMVEFWADPALSYFRDFFRPTRRTVLYCAGGMRSTLAAAALQEMGYSNVAHLADGFSGWLEACRDVENVALTSKWVRRERPRGRT